MKYVVHFSVTSKWLLVLKTLRSLRSYMLPYLIVDSYIYIVDSYSYL